MKNVTLPIHAADLRGHVAIILTKLEAIVLISGLAGKGVKIIEALLLELWVVEEGAEMLADDGRLLNRLLQCPVVVADTVVPAEERAGGDDALANLVKVPLDRLETLGNSHLGAGLLDGRGSQRSSRESRPLGSIEPDGLNMNRSSGGRSRSGRWSGDNPCVSFLETTLIRTTFCLR